MRELDDESRTKKELELQVRQLEASLADSKAAEMRHQADTLTINEQLNKQKVHQCLLFNLSFAQTLSHPI